MTFVCGSCGGRAVAVAVLRKRLTTQAVNDLWQRAVATQRRTGLACPSCRWPMAQVAFQEGASEAVIDACENCLLAWFDPRELETFPERLPAPAPRRLDPKAAEALVRLRERSAQERIVEEADPTGENIGAYYLGVPIRDGGPAHDVVPWVTRGLVGSFALVYVVGLLIGLVRGEGTDALVRWWAYGGFVPAAPWRYGGITILTSFFLHGGILHALTNGYFLLLAGADAEGLMGRRRYLLLLLVGHVAGCVFGVASDPHSLVPCVGASAGISAVFGWYALTLPKTRLAFVLPAWRGTAASLGWWSSRWYRVRVPVPWVFGIWVLVEWTLLDARDGVAHEAHLGGALAGLAWGLVARTRRAAATTATRR